MEARGVRFPRHIQTAPLSRGRCKRFVMDALRKAPAATPDIADLLQADMPDMPRRSALNRIYCCLLRLEVKGLVRRDGRVWWLR